MDGCSKGAAPVPPSLIAPVGAGSQATLRGGAVLTDGAVDTTFGSDGKVSSDLTPFSDSAFGVAVQADGSVVCSGVAGAGGSHASFAVVRYQS